MTELVRRPRWSPYLVGALIGVLSWVTFVFMGKALGVSTTMVRAVGVVERAVAPDYVATNPYFRKYLGTPAKPKPPVEWQFALVLALPLGAWAARRLARDPFRETVPDLWVRRFGPAPWKRYVGAFLGGAILLFGARLAGGCTSGHGISGGLQLAVSSWVFILSMFAAGVLAAHGLFGKEGRSHV